MILQNLLSSIRVLITQPLPSQQLHFCSGSCGAEKKHAILAFFILHKMVPDPWHNGHFITAIGTSMAISSLLFRSVLQSMSDMYIYVYTSYYYIKFKIYLYFIKLFYFLVIIRLILHMC